MLALPRSSRPLGAALLLLSLLVVIPATRASAVAAAPVTGRVFQDFNGSGTFDFYDSSATPAPESNGPGDRANDVGVGGVTVTAFDLSNASVGSTTTAGDGTYTLILNNPASTSVRVEFTTPAGYTQGYQASTRLNPAGTATVAASAPRRSGSSVQFVTGGATDVNDALVVAADHCQRDPNVATSCFIDGNKGAGDPTFPGTSYTYPYAANGCPVSGGVSCAGGTPAATRLSTDPQTGATWGEAWDKTTGKVVVAAAVRRHAPLTEVDNGQGLVSRPGELFTIDPVTKVTTALVDLTADLGLTGVVPTNAARGLPLPSAAARESRDAAVYAMVGKVGIGDIELNDARTLLFVTDLRGRQVIAYDYLALISPAHTITRVKTYSPDAVPNLACTNQGTLRPWGLGTRGTTIAIGVVCDNAATGAPLAAPTASNSGFVVTGDSSAANVSGFTTKDVSLATPGGSVWTWNPWADTYDTAWERQDQTLTLSEQPQPLVGPIVFDTTGNISVTVIDRFGMQTGFRNLRPVADVVLEANANTTFVTGIARGAVLRLLPTSPPVGLDGVAGIAGVPGSADLKANGVNPYVDYTGGTFTYNLAGLGATDKFEVFLSQLGTDAGVATFGKASGLGDLEVLCENAPIEIGNRVWADTDANGIQDPGEAPIAGVTLNLYNGAGTLVGTTVTDANGEYNFLGKDSTHPSPRDAGHPNGYTLIDPAATIAPGATYYVRADRALDSAPGGTLAGRALAPANQTGGRPALEADAVDSDAVLATPTGLPSFPTITVVAGAAGASDHTRDLGFATAQLFNLGDKIWVDANNDGLLDNGETGRNALTVALLDGAGNPVLDSGGTAITTTTSGDGDYLFTGLPNGTYRVQITTPAGFASSTGVPGGTGQTYEPTAANRDVDAGLGSNNADHGYALGATIRSTPLVINGANRLQADLGIFQPLSLGNLVWNDTNNNGLHDVGEPGSAGLTVELVAGTGLGAPIATTTTGADGTYLFSNLLPGSYLVQVTLPVGSLLRTSTGISGLLRPYEPGKDPGVDATNDDDNGTATANPLVLRTSALTLALGGAPLNDGTQAGDTASNDNSNLSVDFGVFQPAAVGDKVFRDANGNGIQDAGEPGIDGVTVQLFQGSTMIGTTTTAGGGLYLFDGLPPGDYHVVFVLPAGESFAPANIGTNDLVDSDANTSTGVTATFTLTPGQRDLSWDAGLIPAPSSLGDFVWIDANRNGIQDAGEPGVAGVTATLSRTDGPLVGLTGGAYATPTAITDSAGNYLFQNLPAGTYVVTFSSIPAGYGATPANKGSDDAKDSDGTTVGITIVSPPTVLPAATVNLTVDQGIFAPVSVGDFAWLDANLNGIQDSGEPGLAGVTVTLLDSAGAAVTTDAFGNAIAPFVTTGNGAYAFTNLLPGVYKVRFAPPPHFGYTITDVNANGNDTKDSDAGKANGGIATSRVLGPNDSDITLDAGFIPLSSLGDYVFLDTNGNGIQDANDGGVPGVKVILYDGTGVKLKETTTDSTGTYSFDDLYPGEYIVEFVPPAGTILTINGQGTSATDSNPDPTTRRTPRITLGADQRDATIDAGLVLLPTTTPPAVAPASQVRDTATPGTLPRTGANIGRMLVGGLSLLGLGALACGLGLALARRRRHPHGDVAGAVIGAAHLKELSFLARVRRGLDGRRAAMLVLSFIPQVMCAAIGAPIAVVAGAALPAILAALELGRPGAIGDAVTSVLGRDALAATA